MRPKCELNKIDHLFRAYKQKNDEDKKLKFSTEGLYKEITNLNEKLNRANEQIHAMMKKNDSSEDVYLLYINLKKKNEQLLKDIENIKQEKEILVKHYEEKILIYKKDLEKERNHFEVQEIVNSEKLQAHEASAALQNDELELKWQTRVDILNQELKDSHLSCNTLRTQLMNLKNRSLLNSTESDQRIQELQQSLIMAEDKLRKSEEKFLNNQRRSVPTFGKCTKPISPYIKTRPFTYEIRKYNNHNQSYANRSLDSNMPSRHYEPLPIHNSQNLIVPNETIPQNESAEYPKRIRKRKLYNLNDE